jgi:hypothetical protein
MAKRHICKFYPKLSWEKTILYQCGCGIYKEFKTPQDYLDYCEQKFPDELVYFWRQIDKILTKKEEG